MHAHRLREVASAARASSAGSAAPADARGADVTDVDQDDARLVALGLDPTTTVLLPPRETWEPAPEPDEPQVERLRGRVLRS